MTKRLTEYSVHNPYDIELIAVIEGGIEIEKEIHTTLKEYKVKGEWFKYDKIKDIINNYTIIDDYKSVDKLSDTLTQKETQLLEFMISQINEFNQFLLPTRTRELICEKFNIHTTNLSKTLAKMKRLGYIKGSRGEFFIYEK